jgi:Zn/Cd-binding protein ZinT
MSKPRCLRTFKKWEIGNFGGRWLSFTPLFTKLKMDLHCDRILMNEKISKINSLKEFLQKLQAEMIEKKVVEKVDFKTAGLICLHQAVLKG